MLVAHQHGFWFVLGCFLARGFTFVSSVFASFFFPFSGFFFSFLRFNRFSGSSACCGAISFLGNARVAKTLCQNSSTAWLNRFTDVGAVDRRVFCSFFLAAALVRIFSFRQTRFLLLFPPFTIRVTLTLFR